ncbi:hypothetical protein XENTR_v10020159 [Xenopus tropicalis]|uniref:Coiled-coil domain-containing protein 180 isoform X3 n=1 Tax=Xenopus tropicalis TaxID=8364 RepID=A0A8J1INV5_XENTR|nr:coiled-coil domain-containing protein 180 isoform X3 [Xenopus tropicalis]KAE8582533.1 hypothetical protein XENTR_v10020159 [Xenopus tropicalis]KAE8582534.1 hypothetical protein XENTR_v10020159 [Xenopus tropicalis]
MAAVGQIQAVPSGRVYRQLFDAEVQLVRSLGEARARAVQHGGAVDTGNIPPIRSRDNNTALPESHHQSTDKMTPPARKKQESEDDIAAREVRGLSDVIVPEKKDTGILERIAANRLERHEVALSNLHRELAEISKEMELSVLEVGKHLQQKISESDANIELLFQKLEIGNDSTTTKEINETWDAVTQESARTRQCIKRTESTLLALEENRAKRISEVLKKYTSLLKDICHLMPSDVDRFIHNEAMMINQAILANHRALARLSVNLLEANLKRENTQRFQWQDLKKAWECYQREIIMKEFRVFAEKEMEHIPTSVKVLVDQLTTQLSSLKERRLQILGLARSFVPPTCTRTGVMEWYESLAALNSQAESINKQFLEKLQELREEFCQKFEVKAESCKLVSVDICTPEEAEDIITKELSPVTAQIHMKFKEEQEKWEKLLVHSSKLTILQTQKLLKFLEDVVDIWQTLERGLSKQENAVQLRMEQCRYKYDSDSKAKEANLDKILDRLRQDSTKETLRSTLGKALASLETIKAGYKTFHLDQVAVIDSYPALVLAELASYSCALSNYFGVKEVYGQVQKKDGENPSTSITTIPADGVRSHSREGISVNSEFNSYNYSAVESVLLEGEWLEGPGDGTHNTREDTEVPGIVQCDSTMAPVQTPYRESTQAAEGAGEQTSQGAQIPFELFTTSKGNTYTALRLASEDDTAVPEFPGEHSDTNIFMTEAVLDDSVPLNHDIMVIPEQQLIVIRKSVRLGFFEHLETWFGETLSSAQGIVSAKKEEFNSELALRYHLHEPRSQRIEMDIHNVRAAELILHSERVDRHCDGVSHSLEQLKRESSVLIENMKQQTLGFRSKIRAMESMFLGANKSDKLVALTQSLPSILDSHVSGVQTSMRNYRQHVEEMLGTLRDTNSDFIKSFRLFSEGGNFSPDEVEVFRKKLHKASDTIASFEGSIMVDLEGLESVCLEQATEIVKKFEDKFNMLTTDAIFLENIQKLLTNLQVKIKALVVSSNFQTQQINSSLEQLQQKTDACAHPNMDKETVTAEELYSFVQIPMGQLAKRSLYLSCLLEPSQILSETPLQGPIATASRSDTPLRQDAKGTFTTPDNLLTPSRVGKLALDDPAVSVIKNITRTKRVMDSQQDSDRASSYQRPGTVSHQAAAIAPHPPSQSGKPHLKKKKPPSSNGENPGQSVQAPSVRKLTKPSRFDKKYQLFGENRVESDNFKGILTCILWESNDTLLYLAEEFYKKKDRRNIGRTDLLQETFEECADTLVFKLQSYEKQALEYQNNCLLEFREQLQTFERLVNEVPPLVIESHRRQHLDKLLAATDQIRKQFAEDLQRWDQAKETLKSVLRPNLGHPDSEQALGELCQQEELRQREEAEGIDCNTKQLQACVSECTQHFLMSLASLTERLLLELDETLTVDDVLAADVEIPKEKLSTLIRRKQAGLPLESTEHKPLVERGSRVWPGIGIVDPTDPEGDSARHISASVTTAKTTVGHISAVQARDSTRSRFLQDTEAVLTRIREESRQQHFDAQRWRDWWCQSVRNIKALYMG